MEGPRQVDLRKALDELAFSQVAEILLDGSSGLPVSTASRVAQIPGLLGEPSIVERAEPAGASEGPWAMRRSLKFPLKSVKAI